ncbi:MAG TPA: YqiA/YcfP family alpha/beta fold hydrolase [Kofleriaceae bacterium]|nr:YqiA/YcfP family alpha/beta fold hydrolase [Kofleriaceae bacterium]
MADATVIYGHGFASGPLSSKGRAVRDRLAGRGIAVELLDLRVPTAEGLRLSRMIEVVGEAVDSAAAEAVAGAAAPPVLAIGSSLGGLTMARAAERDPRIAAVVLLAPAFCLAERWRARLGEVEWARWQRDGVYPYDDYSAPGGVLQVDFGFIEDAARADVGWPDVLVPTTIVHGSRDETVDPALSRAFAAARPHVRLIEVDDDHQLLGSLDVIHAEVDRALAGLAG